jgi:hypothetical protein
MRIPHEAIAVGHVVVDKGFIAKVLPQPNDQPGETAGNKKQCCRHIRTPKRNSHAEISGGKRFNKNLENFNILGMNIAIANG